MSDAFGGVYAGKRVLVTGHTGFKGAWLAAWLVELGAEVTGLALDPPTKPSVFELIELGRRITDRRIDVRDADAVARAVDETAPEFVFHLAAQSLVRASYEQPVETFDTNVQGTVHVLDAIRVAARPCTVVAVTTDKVYESRVTETGYSEGDPLGGHDPYAASKAAAEVVIASYRRAYFARSEGIALASARAGNVIGGGDWARDRIVPDAIDALRAGRPIPVRNPRSVRPWQHVLEPLSGYLWLGAELARGRRDFAAAWNFGPLPADTRTVRELVELLVAEWSSGTPAGLAGTSAGFAAGRWEDASRPDAPHEAAVLTLSIDHARDALRWTPTWSFADATRQTVAWYRAWAESRDLAAMTSAQIAAYTGDARRAGARWA